MPTYILLSTLTPEGRQTLHKSPDRLEEVNKEITDFGCKVIAQYAVLGAYDFITVVEAPITKPRPTCRSIWARGERSTSPPCRRSPPLSCARS